MKQPSLVKQEQEQQYHEVLLAEGRQRSEDLRKKMCDTVAEFVKERQQMEKVYMKISDTLCRIKTMAILSSSTDEVAFMDISSMDIAAFEEQDPSLPSTSLKSCDPMSEPEVPEPAAQVNANPFYETVKHVYQSDCIYKSSCLRDTSCYKASRMNFNYPRPAKKNRLQRTKLKNSKKTVQAHDVLISFEVTHGRKYQLQLNLVQKPQHRRKYHRIPYVRKKYMTQQFQETSSDSSGFVSGPSDCDFISKPDRHLSVTHQPGGNFCMANDQVYPT